MFSTLWMGLMAGGWGRMKDALGELRARSHRLR